MKQINISNKPSITLEDLKSKFGKRIENCILKSEYEALYFSKFSKLIKWWKFWNWDIKDYWKNNIYVGYLLAPYQIINDKPIEYFSPYLPLMITDFNLDNKVSGYTKTIK